MTESRMLEGGGGEERGGGEEEGRREEGEERREGGENGKRGVAFTGPLQFVIILTWKT